MKLENVYESAMICLNKVKRVNNSDCMLDMSVNSCFWCQSQKLEERTVIIDH